MALTDDLKDCQDSVKAAETAGTVHSVRAVRAVRSARSLADVIKNQPSPNWCQGHNAWGMGAARPSV